MGILLELVSLFSGNFHAGLGGDAGLKIPVCHQAGTCGDQLTDDDVLLQADQVVNLALDSGISQDLGGFLEDAADRKESVAREALVIPISTALPVASFSSVSPASIRAWTSALASS